MVLTTTQTTTIITTPHPISFPTSLQSLAGLKRKGNSACPIKSKMKRADSASSLNAEGQGRDSSDSDYRLRTEIDKKRKAKSDRTNSPTSRSVTEAEMEPYLNSYPIQMSNGSSYPQNNIVAEGNAPADWFNLGQPQTAETTQGLVQRYHQSTANPTYNTAPLFSGTEPTQTGYTHGMDCNTNTAMYYQSQSYPTTMPQNSISHSIQQMDFPDPFGIGGGDLNGLDLCWLVDDMDLPDSAADVYNNRVPAFEREREIPHQPSPRTPSLTIPGPPVLQKVDSSNSVYCGETSSAFGSNEAYTSHEDSSLTSCTSSDDGCFDEFDATPSLDQSMCDAMAVITNSQRRRLSKSSLALNSIYNTTGDAPFNMSEVMTTGAEDKLMGSHPPQTQTPSQYPALSSTAALSTEIAGWFKGDDEDLVLGIVEAFSS